VWPLSADFQKEDTPIPMGDTIPNPVITTRDAIMFSKIQRVLTYQNFREIGRGDKGKRGFFNGTSRHRILSLLEKRGNDRNTPNELQYDRNGGNWNQANLCLPVLHICFNDSFIGTPPRMRFQHSSISHNCPCEIVKPKDIRAASGE